MIIVDCEQGSEMWLATRAGLPTGSNFSRILTSTGKVSTSVDTLMYELIAERLAGKPLDNFTTPWMDRGRDLEALARDAYQFITESEVQQVGFCMHDLKHAGCSPDGLVGEGGFEVKCPKASTHVKYLLQNKVPADYFPQVQGSLWITGREWWDFMSFHPDFEPLIIRCYRDDKYIESLAAEVDKLSEKVTAAVSKLKRSTT